MEEAITSVQKLVFLAGNGRDVHFEVRRAGVFDFLAGEDVEADQMDVGGSGIIALGGFHVDDLAGTALEDDVAVLKAKDVN